MKLTFQKLTQQRASDFFDFFDNTAFCDHPEWSWCYCTAYHIDPRKETTTTKEAARDGARALVENGTMQGYFAYEDSQVVGWCNAAPKESFLMLREDESLWPDDGEKTMAIVCFTIAPARRGSGIASALLDHVIEQAVNSGFTHIEAYSQKMETFDPYDNFHGTAGMFASRGFIETSDRGQYRVVRKQL